MSKINATVVADSVNPQGDRLTSLLITFPRILLSEVNTHRMLSKNTSSSRAIPFEKMVQAVQNNPFIPIVWQKEHKGMQGSEYISDERELSHVINEWNRAKKQAIQNAEDLHDRGVTKQLCNRLLEPFMWTTMLITGSKEGWNNFFNLRCPQYQTPVSQTIEPQKSWKDLMDNHSNPVNEKILEDNKDNILFKLQHNKGQAEIHMMMLSEKIYDAVNESTPKQLIAGEWHIPFEDNIDLKKLESIITFKPLSTNGSNINTQEYNTKITLENMKNISEARVKISTAMAARTSYTVVGEEKGIDYAKMIELHDRLITQDPPHSSPMEHCCICVTDEDYNKSLKGEEKGWFRNYKGFKSYRQIIEESK